MRPTKRPSAHQTLLLATLLAIVSTQLVEDLTYAEHLVNKHSHSKSQISIRPEASIFQHYRFPEACAFDALWTKSVSPSSAPPTVANIDQDIQFVKENLKRFSELGSQLDRANLHLKALPKPKNETSLIVSQRERNLVKKLELEISSIDRQIKNLTEEFKRVILQTTKQSENPIFKESSLQYEKKALQAKVDVWKSLLKEAESERDNSPSPSSPQILERYFSNLDQIFKDQSPLVEQIDAILKSNNELSVVKANVNNLESQLKLHNLEIEEKQKCREEFRLVREKQQYDKEVVNLMEQLKIRKQSEILTADRKYCEGVVIKLIARVKKLMASYNYLYVCVQGLEDAEVERDVIQAELNKARGLLEKLQMSKVVNEFREAFDRNRKVVLEKVNQITEFEIDQYANDPEALRKVIAHSSLRIEQIDRDLANLPNEQPQVSKSTQNYINRLIWELKELKARHCKANSEYEEAAQRVYDKIYGLKEQAEYNKRLKRLYREKMSEIEDLKKGMIKIKKETEDYIAQKGLA